MVEDEVKDSTSSDDDDVIADAKRFLTASKEANAKNIEAGRDDLRFLIGGVNQWDPQDAAQRIMDFRPMITVNKLPTFLHQVTNNIRRNKTSIKIHPGSGGSVDVAKVRQGIIRHIEYKSNADVAYSTAACSAAAIGFGYFAIETDFINEKSFYQELKFRRIRNPFTVHFDPLSQSPDGADQRKCLIEDVMSRVDFKRQYPNAKANDDLGLGDGDIYTGWLTQDTVLVANYYRIEETAATLCMLDDGTTVWKDEMPLGAVVISERASYKCKTMWYKLTGADVLEKTEIKCPWIPVFPVYGDEIVIDGEVTRSGIIRNAKDPMRMYNYWMTCATEEIALRPKAPFVGAHGQFEGFEKDWALANRKSFPYLQYNPIDAGGQLAPAPQRQPMGDIPSGVLQMAMHANDNIKATTGLFDSSLGARGNATSGKQELAQQAQGDTANFHFTDSMNIAVRQAGRCANYMLSHYYDTKRVVEIMGQDDLVFSVEINAPNAIDEVLNDMTSGEYTVTVDTGPSYQTLRQEASELFSEMAHNNQSLMQTAGDLIIAEMDIPGADKIAARLKKAMPPQLTQGENEGDKEGIDAKLQQIGQMMQEVDQKSQMMQEAGQQLEETQAKVRDEMASLEAEKANVAAERTNLEAQNRINKAEAARLFAELKLASIPENGDEIKFEFERWKTEQEQETARWKAQLEQDTKFMIAEMATDQKAEAALLSANTKDIQHGTP